MFDTSITDKSLIRDAAYVDGAWIKNGRPAIAVANPATGEVIAHVPDLDAGDVSAAIGAARQALPGWAGKTAKERAAILKRWYEEIMANQEDLARIMTAEQGKPLFEARGEVAYGASFIEWFAEEGKRVYGDVIPTPMNDRRILTLKQPVGVVAAITPWNFPNAMITRKAAPALAAGCTIVIKPAHETPLSALALAALAEKAGMPKGVLNIVTGLDAQGMGHVLTTHPEVRKISFTGSTRVGKILMQQASGTVKRMSMELGGNAPFIVFDDADLDAAVEGAIASKYRNAGQTCVCANRFFVQSSVHDAFAEKFAAAVKALKVGNGAEAGTMVGPMITPAAVEKTERLIASAVSDGAAIVTGGTRHALGGSFFAPTILSNVTNRMEIAQEEIFGPVAPVMKFETEEDAIQMANDTQYGLASYFYARDIGRIWRVMEGLEYGMVAVNAGILSTEVAPFGGVKESGIGREGSRYGIDEYLDIKYIALAGVNK